MRRREVLASMAAATAGCSGLSGLDPTTNSPGTVAPFEPADPPDGADCPDGTTCWSGDGSDGAPVVVPERTTVEPETPTRFALANPTDEDLSFGPYAWGLLKRSGDAWVDVLLRLIKDLEMELPPGDSYAWTVDLAPTYVLGAPDTSGWDERASVDGIGGARTPSPSRSPTPASVTRRPSSSTRRPCPSG